MSRPRFVTLRLRQPRMGATAGPTRELIRLVQQRLAGLRVDGLYGCATSARVQLWQHQQGSPNTSGAITPDELLVMLGYRRRPDDWTKRAAGRLRDGKWTSPAKPVAATCQDPPVSQGVVIVSRGMAGLRPPRQVTPATHYRGIGHVVHYQGPGRGAVGLEASLAQLRGFQNYHMDTHGWSDIGYNWAIPRGTVATVVELRGRNVRGAHSGDNVANAQPGVLLMFGEDDDGPTADQLTTLQALARSEGWGRRTGHLEWSPTSCPAQAMPWVRAHR